ncbi:hypothetical protein ABEB36_002283 [Hypothenemus hampei]|uniref:Protein dead ringer n=1 Tax=Hypothenemus hampei TaxID=57062 RepID=A0ABD1F5K3_HYPHA
MDMDPQDRDGEIGDESPMSNNEDDLSDTERQSAVDPEDQDSCEDLRRQGLLAEHNDVLAKLKMQVRDINVRDEFENQRNQLNFAMNNRNPDGSLPFPVPFNFPHPATSFLPPMAPPPQAASSGSPNSSEGSASSQHNWSFEEQFKQVRQLYEINDDPRRKEFLDDLFSFMQRRGTPINRLPIMAKSVLDLYELYNLVIARGGLVDVINKKLWQEIIKGLHLPSSITSAAFTLRTQYMKYLYPYECDKRHLSTPVELQAAIDGNRREGRRNSYTHFDTVNRSPNPAHQLNHLSLVNAAAAAQQQQMVRMNSVMTGGLALHNGVHHPSQPQPLNPATNGLPALPNLSNIATGDLESRMFEYVKAINHELSLYNGNAALHHGTHPEPQREPINLSEPTGAVKREPSDLGVPGPSPARRRKVEPELVDEARASTPTPPESPDESNANPTVVMPKRTCIKIDSRDNTKGGEKSLVVCMQFNGITYEGVLFAQNGESSGTNGDSSGSRTISSS